MSIWISMHCSMSNWLVSYIEYRNGVVCCVVWFAFYVAASIFPFVQKMPTTMNAKKKHETKIEIWKREMLFNLHFNKTFTLSHPFGCLRFYDAAQELCINFVLKTQNATIDNLHKMNNRRNILSDKKRGKNNVDEKNERLLNICKCLIHREHFK